MLSRFLIHTRGNVTFARRCLSTGPGAGAKSNTAAFVGAGILTLAALGTAGVRNRGDDATAGQIVAHSSGPVKASSPPPVDASVPVIDVVERAVVVSDAASASPVPAAPSTPLPLDVPYVIVGGGTAAYFAVRGILARDKKAKVLVITSEPELPYARTPLSKELWFNAEVTEPAAENADLRFRDWAGSPRSVYFDDGTLYAASAEALLAGDSGGVAVLTGRAVVDLNVYRKKLQLDDNRVITFDKCLLATGSEPKKLAVFAEAEKGVGAHTQDFRALRDLVAQGKRVVVIGGGFLGSELSVALAAKSKVHGGSVTQLFPESGNLAKVLPTYLSEWTTAKVISEGVTVVANTRVTGAVLNGSGVRLQLSTGGTLDADHVVVAVGCTPNTQLAAKGFLEVDPLKGGVVVNSELEARSDVWAAGDVANFFDPTLGRRREEHHDHAAVSGRLAGENMAGARKPYFHQSMFWSDLGPEVGFEAIGLVDPKLDTVGIWAKAAPAAAVDGGGASVVSGDVLAEAAAVAIALAEADARDAGDSVVSVPDASALPVATTFGDGYGKGVVFYMRDRAVVGLVMWNLPNKIPVARKIIRSQKKFDNVDDLAQLLRVHDS